MDHHAEAAGAADTANRGRGDDENLSVADGRELAHQRLLDGLSGLVRVLGALLERVQHHEHGASVRRVGTRCTREADDVHRMRNARRLQSHLDDALVDGVGAIERGGRRELRDGDEIAAVDRRDEANRRLAELVHAEDDDADVDDEHQHRQAHEPADHPRITVRSLFERPVEGAEESFHRPHVPGRLVLLAVRLEEQRA